MLTHIELFEGNLRRADLEELSLKGHLLEANRRFFHPLGLHLCLQVTGELEEPYRLQLLDCSDEPGGVYFGRCEEDGHMAAVLSARRREAALRLERRWAEAAARRRREYGYVRQPIEDL